MATIWSPVYLANAIIITVLGTSLGYGAYRKYIGGNFSWKVASVWTGAVGLFAGVDYFISKWFIQNKYPTKD